MVSASEETRAQMRVVYILAPCKAKVFIEYGTWFTSKTFHGWDITVIKTCFALPLSLPSNTTLVNTVPCNVDSWCYSILLQFSCPWLDYIALGTTVDSMWRVELGGMQKGQRLLKTTCFVSTRSGIFLSNSPSSHFTRQHCWPRAMCGRAEG